MIKLKNEFHNTSNLIWPGNTGTNSNILSFVLDRIITQLICVGSGCSKHIFFPKKAI